MDKNDYVIVLRVSVYYMIRSYCCHGVPINQNVYFNEPLKSLGSWKRAENCK